MRGASPAPQGDRARRVIWSSEGPAGEGPDGSSARLCSTSSSFSSLSPLPGPGSGTRLLVLPYLTLPSDTWGALPGIKSRNLTKVKANNKYQFLDFRKAVFAEASSQWRKPSQWAPGQVPRSVKKCTTCVCQPWCQPRAGVRQPSWLMSHVDVRCRWQDEVGKAFCFGTVGGCTSGGYSRLRSPLASMGPRASSSGWGASNAQPWDCFVVRYDSSHDDLPPLARAYDGIAIGRLLALPALTLVLRPGETGERPSGCERDCAEGGNDVRGRRPARGLVRDGGRRGRAVEAGGAPR